MATITSVTPRASFSSVRIDVVLNINTRDTFTVYGRYRVRNTASWISFESKRFVNPTINNAALTQWWAPRLFSRDPRLLSNTTYEYQVSLESDYSNAITGTIRTTNTPSTLGDVSAISDHENFEISVNVNNPEYSRTHVYWRWRARGTTRWHIGSAIDFDPDDEQPITRSGLSSFITRNTTYEYQVSLESDYSNAITGTIRTTNAKAPSLGSHSVVASATSVSITATINDPSPLGTVVLLFLQQGTAAWRLAGRGARQTATPSSRTVVLHEDSLTKGDTYYYHISVGLGPRPDSIADRMGSFVASDPTLSAPSSVTSDNTSFSFDVTVTNPRAVGTTVYARFRKKGETSWTNISAQTATPASATKTFSRSSLTPNTTYEYQVSLSLGYSGATTHEVKTTNVQPSLGTPTPTPSLTSFTVSVTVANPRAVGSTVYFRHRRLGLTAWTSTSRTATPNNPTVTFSISSLSQDTTYQYELSLVSNFSGATTRTVRTTRDVPAPSIGTPVVASLGQTNVSIEVTVSNPASVGTTVYFRHRVSGTTSWSSTSATATPQSAKVTFSRTGLSQAVTYQYQVSLASNFQGALTRTFTTTRDVPDPSLRFPPTVAVMDHSVEIDIGVANPKATGTTVYARYRQKGQTSWTNFSAVSTTPSSATASFTASGLTELITYEYQISLSLSYTGATTREFTTTGTPVNPTLEIPQVTTTHNSASIVVSVSSARPTGTTVYARWRRGSSGSWTNLSAQTATNADNLTFTISGLSASTFYQYQLALQPGFGDGVTRSFTTGAGTPTPAIGIPGVSHDDTTASINVTVANAPAVGVPVYARYREGTSGDFTTINAQTATAMANTVSFNISGLTPATVYSYQVSLNLNYVGASTYSFTTSTFIPVLTSAPTGLAVTFSDVVATVIWEFLEAASHYSVRYRKVTVPANSNYTQFNNLFDRSVVIQFGFEHKTEYEFQVQGHNDKGAGPWSDAVKVTSPEVTTIIWSANDLASHNKDGTGHTLVIQEEGSLYAAGVIAVDDEYVYWNGYRKRKDGTGDVTRLPLILQSGGPGITVSSTVLNFRLIGKYIYYSGNHVQRTIPGPVSSVGGTYGSVLRTLKDGTQRVPDNVANTHSIQQEDRISGIVGDILDVDGVSGDVIFDATTGITLRNSIGEPRGTVVTYALRKATSPTNIEFITPNLPGTVTSVARDGSVIYYSIGSTNQVYKIEGGTVTNHIFNDSDNNLLGIRALKVDATHFYWASSSGHKVCRSPKNNPSAIQILASGLTNVNTPWDIALDSTHVYWCARLSDKVCRVRKDGVGGIQIIAQGTTNVDDPVAIVLDSQPLETDGTQPGTLPSLGTPFVTEAQTTATIFVSVNNAFETGTTVYSRYRLLGDTDWTNISARTALPATPQVSFPVSGLTPNTTYEYQLSLTLGYAGDLPIHTFRTLTTGIVLTNAPPNLAVRWNDNTAIVTWGLLGGAETYSVRYRIVTDPPNSNYVQRNLITGTTLRIPGLRHSTTYEFEVRATNDVTTTDWSDPVQSTSPDPVAVSGMDEVFVQFDPDGDGQLEDVTNRLFSADGRWGGTGRVPLDKILPANGVVTLENSDGHFVKNEIRLNTEIRFGIRLNNVEHLLGGGYIQDVDEFYDPERGIRNLIIIHSGIFDRLAQEDGETAIVISDPFDALTSEVVERALAKNTRVPAAQREIDHGQVRISSSNSPLISTSGLTKANLMQVLRQMAISEGGDLDEGRGLSVRFHSRFAREQTSAIDGRYFADVHEGNRARVVWRDWRSDWYGGHIYTRVRGTQINQVPVAAAKLYSKVYTIDADKPVISANQSYPFIADLQRDPGARELLTVSEALNWNKIRPQDIQFETLAGNAISEGSVSVEPGVPGQIHLADLDDTPSQYRFTIRNNTNAPIRIKQIDLYGEGIQRLSDYQTELENAEAVVEHNIQRTLELGQMYAGAGYNGANTAAATTAYLAYVLQKYSRPRNIAWIEWDARDLYPGEAPGPGRMGLAAQLGATLMVGDIINLVTSEAIRDELAPGSWFVEGGSYSYSVNRGLTYRLNISRRGQVAGRVSNQRVSVTPSSTTPVNVGSSVSLSAGKVYAVLVSASIPAGPIDGSTWSEDDAVLQLVDANGNILRTWLERDFFPGYEVNGSATLRQEVAGSIQLRAKLRATGSPAITVTRLQVIDRDDVS